MKETTSKLLEQVDKEHDWRSERPALGGGTHVINVDVCRVCGLRRIDDEDRDEGPSRTEYSFEDQNGHPLTLREAAARKCLPE
jgi:hypothetical protein